MNPKNFKPPRTEPIVLVVPYPISANRYWVPINVKARGDTKTGKTRQIFVPSTEAKQYKKTIEAIALAAGIRSPLDCKVHIDIKLYPQRPQDYLARMRKLGEDWDRDVMCIDLDNARKCLYDSMKGIVILDDGRKIVRKDSGEIMEPDEHGARMLVTITPLQIVRVQASLLEAS